jgi:hypothetical protein
MPYPWPIADADYEMQITLDIAVDYLERTGQVFPFSEIQQICARRILTSWREGKRHRIRLANDAINVIEKKQAPVELPSAYPRVS